MDSENKRKKFPLKHKRLLKSQNVDSQKVDSQKVDSQKVDSQKNKVSVKKIQEYNPNYNQFSVLND